MSHNIYAMNNIKNILSYVLREPENTREESPIDCEPSLAGTKRDDLWQKIARCPYKILPLAENSFLEQWAGSYISNDINSRFDEVSVRRRLFFRYGSAAKIRLVAKNNQAYSGLFRTGAVGIIRMSLAYDPKIWQSFVPAFELKLFVDDTYSLNMLAMHGISGQDPPYNFFERIFSNKLATPETSALKLAAWILAQTKHWPDPRSCVAMARREENGSLCSKYHAPCQLYFVASDIIIQKMQEVDHRDFRQDLAVLEPEMVLYQVIAADEAGIRAEHIADIILESSFVSSAFCDQQLFFNPNL